MNKKIQIIQRLLGGTALAMCLCFVGLITLALIFSTVDLTFGGAYLEQIDFLADNAVSSLLAAAAALALLLALRYLLERFSRIPLSPIMATLWLAAALAWVLLTGLVSKYDSQRIIDAARLFARGDYSPMTDGYFNGFTFQLGMCLLLEGVQRLLPSANIDLLMQAVNTVLGVCTAGIMALLCEEIFGCKGMRRTALLLYVFFLPALFFSIYVYGILPMILLCALGFLCFARYLRTRRTGCALAAALLMGVAYVLKPNALIPIIALAICAVIDVMRTRDLKLLAFSALAFLTAFGLNKLVIWQYEFRSGIVLANNIHPFSWLVIGFADSTTCPGWYNGYMEPFYTAGLTAQEQKAIVMSDLAQRIPQLLADPIYTLDYLWRKIFSQWGEPTYGALRYGMNCDWLGRYNGLAILAYRDGSGVNALIKTYMNIYQQALYMLICIGLAGTMRRRGNAAALVIPVTVIGGFLYHALFEAKSQYIYPYMLYLLPYAAHGLNILENAVKALRK